MTTVFNGVTPVETTLAPGTYEVVVSKDGYRTHTEQVTIVDGQTTSVNAALDEQAGTLNVVSTPVGATVSVSNI